MTNAFWRQWNEDNEILIKLTKIGNNPARVIQRAWILLKSNKNQKNIEIARDLHITEQTVYNIQEKYATCGLNATLFDKKRSGAPKKITPAMESIITAIACSAPPMGRSSWTIKLIQKEYLKTGEQYLSWGSIKEILRSHHLKPWKKKCGASRQLINSI